MGTAIQTPNSSAAPVATAAAPAQTSTAGLTAKLNATQFKQNINSLIKQGASQAKVQEYIDNYSADANGNYVLKAAPAQTTAPAQNGGGLAGTVDPDIASAAKTVEGTFEQGANSVESDIANTGKNAQAAGAKTIAGKGIAYGLSGLETAGDVAGDVAGTAGGLIGDAISPLLSDSVKAKIGDVGTYITNKMNEAGVPPNLQQAMGNIFKTITLEGGDSDAVATATKAVASKTADVASQAADTAKNVANGTADAVKTAAGVVKDTAGDVKDAVMNKVSPTPPIEDTVGKIAQGKTGDVPSFQRALTQPVTDNAGNVISKPLETAGIKTYSDLAQAASDKIKEVAGTQDAKLGEDTTPRPLKSFTKTSGTGANAVKVNYVQSAIQGLKDLYSKTSDADGLSQIKQLESDAKSQGLTVKQVNDLARQYGSEFGSKAFGKTGEALTSTNATTFENIRSGLKGTARDLLPDGTSKALDSQMTDLYKVKDLSSKMAEKVNAVEQRLGASPNLLQKVGSALGEVGKITGVGNFASKLLGIDKATDVTLSATQIEANLEKNLGLVQKALGKSDAGFVKDVSDIAKQNGMMPPDEAAPAAKPDVQTPEKPLTSPKGRPAGTLAKEMAARTKAAAKVVKK